MALHTMNFTYKAVQPKTNLPRDWSHTGVVGSGDLEILMKSDMLDGAVKAVITTPVGGFDAIWNKVLHRFVEENGLQNISIEINDNNATPFVVRTRLQQALIEAGEEFQS